MQEDKDKDDMKQAQILPQETSLEESGIPEAPQGESSLEDKVDETISTEMETKVENDKSWYIVQAYSGFENKVADNIKDIMAKNSLQNSLGEILVPTQKVVEVKKGKRKQKEKKYFPGYVLVKLDLNKNIYHKIKNIQKVTGFLGRTGIPTPVSEKEIDKIMGSINEGTLVPKTQVTFDIGEQVRVCEGPFASFSGLVEEVDEEKSRLKVSVSIFGRPTPIELEYNQVEKN